VVWATGEDIPFVPNKRFGGVTLGGKIAPIFFNTQEDSGSLPIEVDVSKLEMGDVIDVLPYDGKLMKNGDQWSPNSPSRATSCSTKCAPAAAST
jgi:aconitate hydratase 2/2-methylisocitrate dehydratase